MAHVIDACGDDRFYQDLAHAFAEGVHFSTLEADVAIDVVFGNRCVKGTVRALPNEFEDSVDGSFFEGRLDGVPGVFESFCGKSEGHFTILFMDYL
jgi:hypothetical protein